MAQYVQRTGDFLGAAKKLRNSTGGASPLHWRHGKMKQPNAKRNERWIGLLYYSPEEEESDRIQDEVEAAELAAGWPIISYEHEDASTLFEALEANDGAFDGQLRLESVIDGQWYENYEVAMMHDFF